MAQSANNVGESAPCLAQKAELERLMDIARSKGQMLLRRQLADQIATWPAGCKQLPPEPNPVQRIETLEKEIHGLRARLDAAEAELLKLKTEAHR